ncbi:CPBP family intramembrane glutamic endopeptidase [Longitalea arenae]|uniref:CPBP family intramembrane glutamic endopeptidase n=1 Tax=Longitalea arenae TaxID=2812558 RepID=UPI001967B45C|nr:CPBP family intramembrane glutamic endopeptidase [Longitalea arenae]
MASGSLAPAIKQGWIRALLLLFVFLLCSILAGVLAGFIVIVPAATDQPKTPVNELKGQLVILSLIITAALSITLTVIFRRYIDRKPVNSLGFSWLGYKGDALTGFSLGIVLTGSATLLLAATDKLAWTAAHVHGSDLFMGLILMALIALTEEMVFRGYILNNLMESMNKWAALFISAALFMLAHTGNPGITSIATVNLLLAGALLGINFIYTRNLWFAICFHFSWNFFQGPVLGYEVSGLPLQGILQPALHGPWWLTGGAFGLEGSFIATVLFALTLLLFYTVYEKAYVNTVSTSA